MKHYSIEELSISKKHITNPHEKLMIYVNT